jgi:pyridoxamine 5'-phosphate oxidase
VPTGTKDIASIRKDYQLASLDEATAGDDPLAFFGKWFAEAEAAEADEVNAMTLATVDLHHKPHARVVLLKGLEEHGFVFYTNYSSSKGHEIEANNHVAAVFFWKELERQVRIEGLIEKVPDTESDIYFNSRPAGSRIGAWASPQSQEIPGREILENNYKLYQSKFTGAIPRPPHWGGYIIKPESIEFWQGRSSRMHDRILFTKTEQGWRKSRLAP